MENGQRQFLPRDQILQLPLKSFTVHYLYKKNNKKKIRKPGSWSRKSHAGVKSKPNEKRSCALQPTRSYPYSYLFRMRPTPPSHRPAWSARVVNRKSKRLATTILSVSQRRSVGTVLQTFQTMSQYSYDAMLR